MQGILAFLSFFILGLVIPGISQVLSCPPISPVELCESFHLLSREYFSSCVEFIKNFLFFL